MKNLKLFQIIQLKLVLQNESLCQFTCNADGHHGCVRISPVRSCWRQQPAEQSCNVFETFHQNLPLPSIIIKNIVIREVLLAYQTMLVAAVVATAVSDIVVNVVIPEVGL
jgi:hypothetical protein